MRNRDTISPLQRAEATAKMKQARFAMVIVVIISGMVLALMVLAANTQVPQIARAAGVVIPQGNYSRIESVEGGIVSSVLVRDGDLVEVGDVLLEVRNPSLVQEREQLRDSLDFARQRLANVEAIAAGIGAPTHERDAVLLETKTQRLNQAATRLELFYNAQAIQRTTIQQKRKTTETLSRALSQTLERVANQEALLKSKSNRFSRGLLTQNDLQAAQSQFEDARARASDTRISLVEAEESLILAEAERESQKLVLLEEILQEKSELEAELRSLGSDADIVEERMAHQQIRATARGRIQFADPISLGEYIEPGKIVFELLPIKQTLVVEVKVSNTDYGYIDVGQPVSVSFDNFDARRYGKVQGTVSSLSPVPLIDENTGETYFRTNIDLSRSSIGEGQFRRPIEAGFTSVAEMQTGGSSLLSYILRPIERTLSTAFSER